MPREVDALMPLPASCCATSWHIAEKILKKIKNFFALSLLDVNLRRIF
jgi:hypothetical protein